MMPQYPTVRLTTAQLAVTLDGSGQGVAYAELSQLRNLAGKITSVEVRQHTGGQVTAADVWVVETDAPATDLVYATLGSRAQETVPYLYTSVPVTVSATVPAFRDNGGTGVNFGGRGASRKYLAIRCTAGTASGSATFAATVCAEVP